MSLKAGDMLRNRYEIVRLIKSGGMGSVCEARDLNLANSPCAIKEVLEGALSGPNTQYIQDTFEKEMKALVELDHPSIPKVRDFFQEGERRYIVMEFVRGHSLEDECNEHKETMGRGMPPGKVVSDILQLLDTVAYLHRLKPPILHRDIKPANIIRDEKTGRIKLVDFGLAKAVGNTVSPQTMVGTLGYCAPEQLSGKAETRSDLYSVAATMYQMLTGDAPQLSFDPLTIDIPGLRPGLDRILAKATEPRVTDRYNRAEEFALDLRTWQSGHAGASLVLDPVEGEAGAPTVIVQNSGSSQWAWAAVATIALGLGLMVGRVGQSSTPAVAEAPSTTPTAVATTAVPAPVPTPTASTTPARAAHKDLGYVAPPAVRHRPPPRQHQVAAAAPPVTKMPGLGEGDAYPSGRSPAPSALVLGKYKVSVVEMSAPIDAIMGRPGQRRGGFRRAVQMLQSDPRLHEDWELDQPASVQARHIIMRGPKVAGAYLILRQRGLIRKVAIRPAPDGADLEQIVAGYR